MGCKCLHEKKPPPRSHAPAWERTSRRSASGKARCQASHRWVPTPERGNQTLARPIYIDFVGPTHLIMNRLIGPEKSARLDLGRPAASPLCTTMNDDRHH